MQTNPAVEQSKIIRWSKSPWYPSGIGKDKVYGGNDLRGVETDLVELPLFDLE